MNTHSERKRANHPGFFSPLGSKNLTRFFNWTGGIILLCFFLSGASALIYEVVWVRMLVLTFGTTTLAVSTVLTAFMTGLALGSLWSGRVVDNWKRPLKVYGILEFCIGFYGLLVPFLFPLLTPFYQALWELFHPSFFLFSLLRFALAMMVLLVPTTLMGATLPVLASYYAGRRERSERRIGLLYTLNTAGAVVGTWATGFILLPHLGVQETTLTAAALNLLLGLTALWISERKSFLIGPSIMRTDREPSYEGFDKTDPSFAAMAFQSSQKSDAPSGLTTGIILAAFALSGYTALVYEVAWTRVLSMVLGSSIYAFSTMLSTFLLGLALGSALFTLILDKLKWPVRTLVWVQVGIGLTCYVTSFGLQRLPYFFLQVLSWGLPGFQDHPDRFIMALWFASAMAIMIIPTLLFGGTFPLVVKIYHPHAQKMGRTAGDAYSVNTVGAILGAFFGGFILIPSLGLRWTLLVTILVNLTLGILLTLAAPFKNLAVRAGAVLSISLAFIAISWVGIPWSSLMMTFNLGIEYPRYLQIIQDFKPKGWSEFHQKLAQGLEVEFYEEGSTATVTVVRDAVGHHYLKNDGRPEGGEPYLRTHVLLGQLPMLLAPANGEDKAALIIGLGTGVTLGSVQQHPLKGVEVVELEPAVVPASNYFRNFSPHRLDDPRLKVIINDGRNYLLANKSQYDILISQPSFPWLTGVSNLFTQDFFALGASRLKEGGIFCQWVSVYGMTLENFKSVLKSFHSVFPHVMVFDPAPPDMILIGSKKPFQIDLARLEERFKNDSIRKDLERVNILNPYDLLGTFSIGSSSLDSFLADAVLNTDDNAWVEVNGPRDYYAGRINGQPEAIRDALYKSHQSIEFYLAGEPETPVDQRAEQLLELAQAYYRQDNFPYASFYADRSLQLKESALAHLLMARLLMAYSQRAPGMGQQDSSPLPILRAAIQATQVARRLDPRLPEVLHLQAELYQRLGDTDQVIATYQKLLELNDRLPDIQYTLASLLQAQGRHKEAKGHYRKFLAQVPRGTDYANLADLARKQLQAIDQQEKEREKKSTPRVRRPAPLPEQVPPPSPPQESQAVEVPQPEQAPDASQGAMPEGTNP